MTVEKLDYIFPFVVFGYGVVMTFILNNPKLIEIAEQRLPSDMWSQFKAKKVLAMICLVIGSLWSLQNIWLK